jgi:molybdopterin-guanine dinucleotide biosynthesis protein A
MKKHLWVVYKNGYIEYYCLIYASNGLEVVSEYCKEFNKEMMTLDEFHETHTVDIITHIGNKKIKELIFEEEV